MFQVSVEKQAGIDKAGYVEKYGPFETIKEAKDCLLEKRYIKYPDNCCTGDCENLSHFFFLKGLYYARVEACITVLPIEQIP